MRFRTLVFASMLAAVASASSQVLPADGCLHLEADEDIPACTLSVSAQTLLDVSLRRGGCTGPLFNGQIWEGVQTLDIDIYMASGTAVVITSHYKEDQPVIVQYSLTCKRAPGTIIARALIGFVGLSLLGTALTWCRIRAVYRAVAPAGYAPVSTRTA